MKIMKIKIECLSCDKYFILAHNGEDQPTCCAFCGSELETESNDEPNEDIADTESLDFSDSEIPYDDTIYSDED